MVVVLEIAGIAAIGVVVLVLYRAAAARTDDTSLLLTARIALCAWIGFALFWLIDLEAVKSDPIGVVINGVILAVVIGGILGYRKILGLLKARAGNQDNQSQRP